MSERNELPTDGHGSETREQIAEIIGKHTYVMGQYGTVAGHYQAADAILAWLGAVGPEVKANQRAAFEAWLQKEQLLTATWNEERNCFDEFPAHLAYQAWQAAVTDIIGRLKACPTDSGFKDRPLAQNAISEIERQRSAAGATEIGAESEQLRKILELVRTSIVIAIAFLGRDHGTSRAKSTVPQLIDELTKADQLILATLSDGTKAGV
jgi:hypothetical protein